jgi:hypothetical protein
MALVSREHVNEHRDNDVTRNGASGSALDEARRIVNSIPRVPDNDRGNRNWRAVRLWAEVHSSEILGVFDAVKSKTTTAELLGLRSLGPFHTACLREGHIELVPRSRRARSKTGMPSQQLGNAGLERQVTGLVLELRSTRRAVVSLHKWLRRSGIAKLRRGNPNET